LPGLECLGWLSQGDRCATAGWGNLDPALPVTEGGIDDERESQRLGVEGDRFVSIADGESTLTMCVSWSTGSSRS
jgi:hypothetical protein